MLVMAVSPGARCQEGASSSSLGMPPEGVSSTAREQELHAATQIQIHLAL